MELKIFLLLRDSVAVYYYSIAHDLYVHGGVVGNRFNMSQSAKSTQKGQLSKDSILIYGVATFCFRPYLRACSSFSEKEAIVKHYTVLDLQPPRPSHVYCASLLQQGPMPSNF